MQSRLILIEFSVLTDNQWRNRWRALLTSHPATCGYLNPDYSLVKPCRCQIGLKSSEISIDKG